MVSNSRWSTRIGYFRSGRRGAMGNRWPSAVPLDWQAPYCCCHGGQQVGEEEGIEGAVGADAGGGGRPSAVEGVEEGVRAGQAGQRAAQPDRRRGPRHHQLDQPRMSESQVPDVVSDVGQIGQVGRRGGRAAGHGGSQPVQRGGDHGVEESVPVGDMAVQAHRLHPEPVSQLPHRQGVDAVLVGEADRLAHHCRGVQRASSHKLVSRFRGLGGWRRAGTGTGRCP